MRKMSFNLLLRYDAANLEEWFNFSSRSFHFAVLMSSFPRTLTNLVHYLFREVMFKTVKKKKLIILVSISNKWKKKKLKSDQCYREQRDLNQQGMWTSSNTWTRKKRDDEITQHIRHFSEATTTKHFKFYFNNCGHNKVMEGEWRCEWVTESWNERLTMVLQWTPVSLHAVWRLKIESRLWAWITFSTGCSQLWSTRSQHN